MEIGGYIPATQVSMEVDTDDVQEAIRQFKAAHPDMLIDFIDGAEVLGNCEDCRDPVLDSQVHLHDHDQGCVWHGVCPK